MDKYLKGLIKEMERKNENVNLNSQTKALEVQIKELFESIVWSHKAQENLAELYLKRHKQLRILQLVLSALTTIGILITLFGENKVIGIFSAIFSALLFGLNAYTKDYDLREMSQKHSNYANELWNIKESYFSLLTDLTVNTLSLKEIIEKRDNLQKKLQILYKDAPRTISSSLLKLKWGSKPNETMPLFNALQKNAPNETDASQKWREIYGSRFTN